VGCTFLIGNYVFSCNAGKGVYVPSIFEMREYCRQTQYRICPHYLNAKKYRPMKPVPPRIVKVE
jgi:hypothetical protein